MTSVARLDLWLDDERDPHDHGRDGWQWIRTAEELIAILGDSIWLPWACRSITISVTGN